MTRSSRVPSRPWPLVVHDDATYRTIAEETHKRILWDDILNDKPGHEPWTWRENVRNFSIYTKEIGSFRVLSTGVISASVPEVMTILVATSQLEYAQKMAALHDKTFKKGVYMADIETDRDEQHLSVRSVTFASPSLHRRDEEWCFLEATYVDIAHGRFEKLLTSLDPRHVSVESNRTSKRLDGVIAGIRIAPVDATPQRSGSVRVQFYAEAASARSTFHGWTTKRKSTTIAAQNRLMQIAKDCDRLALLVRRRRLGIQLLVDQMRVLPPINALCLQCGKRLLVAKCCRICGQSVCDDCSDKYERETHIPTVGNRAPIKRLEMIRVCDPCLTRVNRGDYSLMSEKAIGRPTIVPDPIHTSGEPTSAAQDLKHLLHDALLIAQSPQRKNAVVNVIRHLLNQERIEDDASTTCGSETSERTIQDPQQLSDNALKALDNLVLRNIPYHEVELAGRDGRSYALTKDYEASFTPTENEPARLEALENLQVLISAPCDELDIVCDMAAKEVGVFASIVSVITEDAMRVVAANNPSFKVIQAERAHSFCAHTIMDKKPLVIPNPEADVRVNYTKVATTLGARFYCGFPLVVDGDKVLGTLCCLDQHKHELTESQFTAMQRLAQIATKIIQMRGDQHRRRSVVP